jgi:ABC-type multidrug transport system ATPase subunit
VLILDEATASLDIPSERQIQAALQTLLADRTAIIIAHRLSTVSIADRVLVMEHGRIIEDDTPPASSPVRASSRSCTARGSSRSSDDAHAPISTTADSERGCRRGIHAELMQVGGSAAPGAAALRGGPRRRPRRTRSHRPA